MNSKYVKYVYANSRGIIAIPTRTDFQINSIDNKISEVNICNEPILELGDKVDFTQGDIQHNYICNKIVELDDRSFLVQESSENICNKFIAPLILNPIKILDSKELYNCYVGETNILYVVFRFSDSKDYMRLEESLIKSPNYISKEDHKNGFVVFQFKIKKEYVSDVIKFSSGNYSKYSSKSKDAIIRYSDNPNVKDVLLKRACRKIKLEERIGMELGNDIELMSKPTEREYWKHFESNILSV